MMNESIRVPSKPVRSPMLRRLRKQWSLQMFVWIGMILLIIFSVIPMFGLLMSFKDYKISAGVAGIFTSPWVGMKHFIEFVNEYNFGSMVTNTIVLSLLKLVFSFPAPILFAIMLNEVRWSGFKRVVQTASYLPNFISWVVVAGLALVFFSADNAGVLNVMLMRLHLISSPLPILTGAAYFRPLAVLTAIWKEMGWWAIIYMAAIAGIDVQLYEAAQIDGASRMGRIIHVTFPSILPTVVVVLVLALGNLLGGGLGGSNFEQSYLLGNAMNNETSNIIQKYAFSVGLSEGRYAYATAVGMIQSVISLALVLLSNAAAKKISGSGLF